MTGGDTGDAVLIDDILLTGTQDENTTSRCSDGIDNDDDGQIDSADSNCSSFYKLLTVNKTGTGSGSVSSSPTGIDCGTDCSEKYLSETNVTLSASASEGSTFSGWSGTGISCEGTGDCTVTLDSAKTATATFTLNTYKLSASVSGQGSVVSDPSGIDCGSDCEETYNHGTSVSLSQTADAGWSFSGWSDACTGNTVCSFIMNMAKSVTATFTKNPTCEDTGKIGTYPACEDPETPTATVSATKVVCDVETDLPNMSGGDKTIDANTATDWINGNSEQEILAHPNCHLASGWNFQWTRGTVGNPGDNSGLASDWNTFTTDDSGVAEATIALTDDLANVSVREAMSNEYIPFTGTDDVDTVSAELYCNGDVLHYDNLEYAGVTQDSTTYCIAFNVKKVENTPELCSDNIDNDGDSAIDLADSNCSAFKPSLTVIKHVVGGELSASAFDIDVDYNLTSDYEFASETLGQKFASLFISTANAMVESLYHHNWSFTGVETPGVTKYFDNSVTDYVVTEVSNADYNKSTEGDCSGTIAFNRHKTCTITNTYKTCEVGQTGTYPNCVTPPASCEEGFHRDTEEGECVVNHPTECGTGYHLSGEQCVEDEKPAEITGGGSVPLWAIIPQGIVLGASTIVETPAVCVAPYLNDHLKMGGKNNVEEVKKLQLFLNEQLGLNIPVTGFFGPMTFEAVKQFQLQNADQILAPWTPFGYSKEKPTGYVYKTTKRWINIMKCKSLDIPLDSLKLNEG